MLLKFFSFTLSPKIWWRAAVFALSVGWLTVLSTQFSLAQAQNNKPNQQKTKKSANSQKNKTNKEKATATRSAKNSKANERHAQKTAKATPKRQANKKQASASRAPKAAHARHTAAPMRVSHGQLAGLHTTADALDLRSSVALVVDQETNEVLYRKNDHAVLPIASLTKLMTGLVISEAHLPMDERIAITQADVDTEKGSSSRLAVGSVLTRGELMHLSLMSSENRAAHALGRTFPGGMDRFVSQMNQRAQTLGMADTRYVEPTGLSSRNQSSAGDLAVLAAVAYKDPMLRAWSTSHGREVDVGRRTLQYNNTNMLVKSPEWDIGLQKTGYISEAGRCLVMQAQVAGRNLIMVFLDSAGKLSRIGDAERVRKWVEKTSTLQASDAGMQMLPRVHAEPLAHLPG